MTVNITFLGAAGTVTGSKYLIETDKYKILVDAGVFQGDREWREKNWHNPPTNLKNIDAVLLTHAHIDHTGILPRYVNQGLNCPVYCTTATKSLSELLLPDMGRLQEEEAEYRSQHHYSRHETPQPLYTETEAKESLKLFRTLSFNEEHKILDDVYATWYRMGHILGAAAIRLRIGGKIVVFSGDIGRYHVPILVDPTPVPMGDLLLIESTYGDRSHAEHNPKKALGEIITTTSKRGGAVVIPSFAVGRAQLLLYYLRELKAEKLIPDIPVIIDSPMAVDATKIYRKHVEDYDEAALGILKRGSKPFEFPGLGFITDRRDSQRLNGIDQPMVIISASGMLTGGRILHHLKHRIGDPRNTILFVGFQPPGGRGAWIKSGAKSLRLFGHETEIRAEIRSIEGLSAHADKDELLLWCKTADRAPGQVAVVHGEPDSAKTFATTLKDELNWNTIVPKYLDTLSL